MRFAWEIVLFSAFALVAQWLAPDNFWAAFFALWLAHVIGFWERTFRE